jgi:predicted dehydrogenase
MSISVCIIGFGNVARKHIANYPKGTETIAVVEPDKSKIVSVDKPEIFTFESIKDAFQSVRPGFWDICTPPAERLNCLKEILSLNDEDSKILIEKPVCAVSQINEFEKLTKSSKVKICVNENYSSSAVNKIIQEKLLKYGIGKAHIIIEFSKNRIDDFIKGRYIDKELGALGYEGTHMISCVSNLSSEKKPKEIISSHIYDLRVPEAFYYSDGKYQGGAELEYSTEDGSLVEVFTFMDGHIKHPIKVLNMDNEMCFGNPDVRYRILEIKEKDVSIIGQYEPVLGWERLYGRVYVIQKGKIIEKEEKIYDNSMKTHIAKALSFFFNNDINPYTIEEGLVDIKFLAQAFEKALKHYES